MARFDLEFGEGKIKSIKREILFINKLSFKKDISGYSFNIGDSHTNNAFGGDAGSTSNSAEIHSNGNRFYIWLVI